MSEQHQSATPTTSSPSLSEAGSAVSSGGTEGGTASQGGTVTSGGTVSSGTASGTVLTEQEDAFNAEKLTLPEGFEKNEHFEEFTSLAKEAGFKHSQVQALTDLYAKAAKANAENVYAAWRTQNDTWVGEVKADGEIGGTRLEEVRQTISKVLDNPELSDPKFREALDFTGAGNNPAVIRTLYRWSKALTEGGAVTGGAPGRTGSGALDTTRPSPGEALYGRDGPHSGGPKL